MSIVSETKKRLICTTLYKKVRISRITFREAAHPEAATLWVWGFCITMDVEFSVRRDIMCKHWWHFSRFFPVKHRVPHGFILGPLLYTLFTIYYPFLDISFYLKFVNFYGRILTQILKYKCKFKRKVDGPLNSYSIDEFVGWVWNMLVLLVDNTVMISNLLCFDSNFRNKPSLEYYPCKMSVFCKLCGWKNLKIVL